MMPPADRISKDPGPCASKRPLDNGHSFLAVGPALRILQLNVEGLSAAKRLLISSIAKEHFIDVICLEETHVDKDRANLLSISGFDLIAYNLHPKYGRATYTRSSIADVHLVDSVLRYDIIRIGGYHIANVYKPPTDAWEDSNSPPVLPHPAIIVGDFNSHHTDWGYRQCDTNGDYLLEWSSANDYSLVHDCKQKGTFRSARWQQDYSPDLCWVSATHGRPLAATVTVLQDFPHSQHRPSILHVGIQLPLIEGIQKRRWNFRKADWSSFTEDLEKIICTIPKNISMEDAYRRFLGALRKAAHTNIPRGFRPLYIPCLDDECQDLLQQYENSGDPDVADHLIESLDAARRHRWEETTSSLDLSHSSRKGWSLIRRLGNAQLPPKTVHPPVKANSVASHIIQIAKAPIDKNLKRHVHSHRKTFLRTAPSQSSDPPPIFTSEDIERAIKFMKSGTAPGYDNIHPEFLKNMGPKACHWLLVFFNNIILSHKIPKIWRKAKVIAIEKPGKDATLASSYRPISLLSVCYKLFERLLLNYIANTVDDKLSPHQAGFRRGRSTCDQVVALTTFIENGFQRRLKTGAVFLDLTAAFDTVWHAGLSYKLSLLFPPWFVVLTDLLLRDRQFRVHMGDDVSSWRRQRNGLPQGSVLAPTLFNLYINDLPDTTSRKFGYADDIGLASQARHFHELEVQLNSDIQQISDYCKMWRLKPNASKTVSCVFHLHNINAKRELDIYMDGNLLSHDQYPVYLGVTLDRTLSYKTHLGKLASKVKSRTNLLSKLAGSSWGANAATLKQSALSLCYSAAEYCCPVWFCSPYTKLVDTQLHAAMRLISGTMRPTSLPWLPVLSNICPPYLRREAAVDTFLQKVAVHQDWPLYEDLLNAPPQRLKSRHPLQLSKVPTDVIGQWRLDWKSAQAVNCHLVEDPAIRQPGFDSLPRRLWCLLNRFRTGQGHCKSCHHRWGLAVSDLCPCGDVQTMTHIVDSCPMTKLVAGGLQTLHSADVVAVDWLTSYGNFGKR